MMGRAEPLTDKLQAVSAAGTLTLQRASAVWGSQIHQIVAGCLLAFAVLLPTPALAQMEVLACDEPHHQVGPADCPTVGDRCADGSIFVGPDPHSCQALLFAPCAVGQTWDGEQCTGPLELMVWDGDELREGHVIERLQWFYDQLAAAVGDLTLFQRPFEASLFDGEGPDAYRFPEAHDVCDAYATQTDRAWRLPTAYQFAAAQHRADVLQTLVDEVWLHRRVGCLGFAPQRPCPFIADHVCRGISCEHLYYWLSVNGYDRTDLFPVNQPRLSGNFLDSGPLHWSDHGNGPALHIWSLQDGNQNHMNTPGPWSVSSLLRSSAAFAVCVAINL